MKKLQKIWLQTIKQSQFVCHFVEKLWNLSDTKAQIKFWRFRIGFGPIVAPTVAVTHRHAARGFRADVVTHVSLIKVRGRRMVFKVERTIWILPPASSKNESLLEKPKCPCEHWVDCECEQDLLTFIHWRPTTLRAIYKVNWTHQVCVDVQFCLKMFNPIIQSIIHQY